MGGACSSVIIPTLADRPEALHRAIASVVDQRAHRAVPIVVVNGPRADPDLLDALRRRTDIRLTMSERLGVSAARLHGRRLVDTPYFALLDDDDEFLPHALETRRQGFHDGPVDVVVTNGYRQRPDPGNVIIEKLSEAAIDPSMSMLERNWLASAGALFATDTVGEDMLDGLPDYLELTVLGYRLALQRRLRFLDVPTFIIHEDAEVRATQGRRYGLEAPAALQLMESFTSRPDLRRRLRDKRCRALHRCAELHLEAGAIAAAWQSHLDSLKLGGARYIPYTSAFAAALVRRTRPATS